MLYKYVKIETTEGDYPNFVQMSSPQHQYKVRDYGYITLNDVDLFCLANEGAGFTLTTKFRLAQYCYYEAFFNYKIKKMHHNSIVKDEFREEMEKLHYPPEIKKTTKVDDIPKVIESNDRGNKWVEQYICYNLEVPKSYVDKINDKYIGIFSKHRDIIRLIADKAVNYATDKLPQSGLNRLKINVYGEYILFQSRQFDGSQWLSFADLGWNNLPNCLYEFALAKAIAEEIINITNEKLTFTEIKICTSSGGFGTASGSEITFETHLKQPELKLW